MEAWGYEIRADHPVVTVIMNKIYESHQAYLDNMAAAALSHGSTVDQLRELSAPIVTVKEEWLIPTTDEVIDWLWAYRSVYPAIKTRADAETVVKSNFLGWAAYVGYWHHKVWTSMDSDNLDMALEMIESMDAKIEELIKRVQNLEAKYEILQAEVRQGYQSLG